MEKPDETTILVEREYSFVEERLRRIFKIPNNELVKNLEWDKNNNSLKLLTIRYPKKGEE